MQTNCVRQGQIEIGIIEHEGRRVFGTWAQPSSVATSPATPGKSTATSNSRLGAAQTMLACRSEVVERYWSGSLALMFRLTRGRFIVGYALATTGCCSVASCSSAAKPMPAQWPASWPISSPNSMPRTN